MTTTTNTTTPTTPAGRGARRPIPVALDPHDIAALDTLADRRRSSRSQVIRDAIVEHITRWLHDDEDLNGSGDGDGGR